ncbi:MAG: N-acetylneuraminate synthase family protein [Myxococcota bacterium]|nr:N-acetylneuraminate synthase family protein [Myxococcota bacterium]
MTTWLHDPGAADACTIIAEVAQAHDGSLGAAHAYVDAAAEAGADAVKFQTHIAAAESTPSEPWRKRFSPQDASRYEYWQRMEFTEEQWAGLRAHAEKRGLLFLSSPFSLEAVELLVRVGVAGWKVASGEVGTNELLDAMAATGQPVLLSTGMSTLEEVDAAAERLRRTGVPLAVMQCSSMYPTPPEAVGLNVIPVFRERYGCAVGLSDHSAEIYAGLAAAALGVDVIEVHLTLSRAMFGPDVPASLTPDQLTQLVAGVRSIECMRRNPVDKSRVPDAIAPLREVFRKSLVLKHDLPGGALLAREHLVAKKPGSGIPSTRLESVLGRRLRRPLRRDDLLSLDDLEPEAR